LPAELSNYNNANPREVLDKICKLKLSQQQGKFLYSDVNFIVLAHLVEIISHEPFDKYVQNHIFDLLNMKSTFYAPAQSLRDQIAPTEVMDKQLRWGKVHDPFAYSQGGIAGNAGLFSNAHDLSLYVSSLLNGGMLPKELQSSQEDSKHFLEPLTIAKMTKPQTPQNVKDVRGLGWDIDSRYSNRGLLFPKQSYGHTGWTGTSIWIDPVTKTWIIILTSRTHPTPTKKNQLIEDRRLIANIVFASINTNKDKLSRV
jgi:serine-type D-Ala-D-Ala carboxypeptidase